MEDLIRQMYENVIDPERVRSARRIVEALQRRRNLSYNEAMQIVTEEFDRRGTPLVQNEQALASSHWYHFPEEITAAYEIDGEMWRPVPPTIGGNFVIASRSVDGEVRSEFIFRDVKYLDHIVRKEPLPHFENRAEVERYIARRSREPLGPDVILVPIDTASVLTSMVPTILNELLADVTIYPYPLPTSLT